MRAPGPRGPADQLEGIKASYRRFAERECRGYSEVYYRLALAIAEDDEVVGFIAAMPVTQPNLFLASSSS